jgi:hypothetical protein
MTNRALSTERTPTLPAMELVVAAAGLLALVVLAVAAVVMYRTADVMMAAPSTYFAMTDYLSLPQITTLVPILTDGPLPKPSL